MEELKGHIYKDVIKKKKNLNPKQLHIDIINILSQNLAISQNINL
jgi:hypothetical protein